MKLKVKIAGTDNLLIIQNLKKEQNFDDLKF